MGFDKQLAVASPTGARLNAFARSPAGPPRAVVQINHGLAEHAARYAGFADVLAERGYAAIAHDHRGHGSTTAPDAAPALFAQHDGTARVIADVGAVHDHIRSTWPGVPVVLFGHSMGGLIGLNYVLRHPEGLAGAAIWNANFSAGLLGRVAQGLLAWERLRLGSDVPSRLLPALTFRAWAKKMPDRRTEFDWLSRDPVEVDRYVADPLCGWDASVSIWRDVFDFVFFGADDANFRNVPKPLPFNLVGGEHDPATDGGKAVNDLARRMRAMGFSSLKSRIYPQTRHECLNDVNRDEVMADFAVWLDDAVLSAGSKSAK